METRLDNIAGGLDTKTTVCNEYYGDIDKRLKYIKMEIIVKYHIDLMKIMNLLLEPMVLL